MKTMKRMLALALAVMLVMSMATTAFAAENEGTIVNETNRTYNAYQIFSGTQAEGSTVLGDIAWGNGINVDTFLPALKTLTVNEDTPFAACATAADVAGVLKDEQNNSEVAKAFANLAAKHLGTVAATVAAKETKTLASGYYLLVDSSTGNDAQNPALLQITNGSALNITDKSDAPEVNKTIQGEGEAADGSIGDTFTFVLEATMPSTFEGYDTYKVVFHDTMSKGLTYVENSIVVPTGFTANVVENTDGTTTITVTNDNVLDDGVAAGATLTVTYQATLNSEAVIGAVGNPNEVYLEYSNDPNWNGEPTNEPTGETPEDEVIVFTYELDVTKKDGQTATTLPSAEFVLYREVEQVAEEGTEPETVTEYVIVDENGKVTDWTTDKTKASTLISDANGLFQVVGLDAGTYYLEETKAPAGYNLLTAPIKIEIEATITDTEDEQSLDKLTISINDGAAADGNVNDGTVDATVENNAGSTLPETGGIGTTMFYIIGGILVLAAVVLLVTKRRMSVAE